MSKLHFLPKMVKEEIEALEHREVILDGFLYDRSINILWAIQGNGKTYFAMALSRRLAALGYEVAYIDTDSAPETVKERGFDRYLGGKLHYLNSELFDDSRKEIDRVMQSIRTNATPNAYNKCVFLLDSLRFFMPNGVYDESAMDRVIVTAKAVRRAGGCMIILAHSTKKGDTIKVGATLLQAMDEVSEMEKIDLGEGEIGFILHPSKKRLKVRKVAYRVELDKLSLIEEDVTLLQMDEREKETIDSIKSALANGELNQNKLLEVLGVDKADRFVRGVLEKYSGRFWGVSVGKNKAKIYTVKHLQHNQHSNTSTLEKGVAGVAGVAEFSGEEHY